MVIYGGIWLSFGGSVTMFSCLSDVDECAISNGGCEQICDNTYGSFECDCQPGYTLNADGFNCSGEIG